MTPERWQWVGELALLRLFHDRLVFPRANQRALALREAIAELGDESVEDLVPGARSLLVILRRGTEPSADLLELLDSDAPRVRPRREGEVHPIAVHYGGDDGPDLKDVSRLCGLSEREVVEVHRDPEYRVGFLGFSPGFPYLLGLPNRLATPRLETPRTRIPAGSVGIGGAYTGVYPRATPGGWRLIGRTDVELFDPGREPPALLTPGDRVRFIPA